METEYAISVFPFILGFKYIYLSRAQKSSFDVSIITMLYRVPGGEMEFWE
jgi:hypothetical protein